MLWIKRVLLFLALAAVALGSPESRRAGSRLDFRFQSGPVGALDPQSGRSHCANA